MLAALGLLIGFDLENIAWRDRGILNFVSTNFAVAGARNDVVFVYGHDMLINITFLANNYTGTAY
jgi:hypothetical protein